MLNVLHSEQDVANAINESLMADEEIIALKLIDFYCHRIEVYTTNGLEPRISDISKFEILSKAVEQLYQAKKAAGISTIMVDKWGERRERV